MKVSVKNKVGLIREIKVGFSWTVFFFGPLPFFFRGMSSSGLAWILLSFCTLGISNLFLMFSINKKTAQHYLEIGYEPVGDGWKTAGKKWDVDVLPAVTT